MKRTSSSGSAEGAIRARQWLRPLIHPPYVLYLHPREIDTRVPVLRLPPHLHYLFYFRLAGGFALLRRVLETQPFVSVSDYLRETAPATSRVQSGPGARGAGAPRSIGARIHFARRNPALSWHR